MEYVQILKAKERWLYTQAIAINWRQRHLTRKKHKALTEQMIEDWFYVFFKKYTFKSGYARFNVFGYNERFTVVYAFEEKLPQIKACVLEP